MDNASKAIILAGGILIGVLIISISMYALATFQSFYESNSEALKAKRIAEFNSYFESIPGTKEEDKFYTKGYEVYSAYNKCQEILGDLDSEFTVNCVLNDTNFDGNIKKYFYFTEKLEEDYEYTYTYNGEGVISSIRFTPKEG